MSQGTGTSRSLDATTPSMPRSLIILRRGSTTGIDEHSYCCLPRVWRAQHLVVDQPIGPDTSSGQTTSTVVSRDSVHSPPIRPHVDRDGDLARRKLRGTGAASSPSHVSVNERRDRPWLVLFAGPAAACLCSRNHDLPKRDAASPILVTARRSPFCQRAAPSDRRPLEKCACGPSASSASARRAASRGMSSATKAEVARQTGGRKY